MFDFPSSAVAPDTYEAIFYTWTLIGVFLVLFQLIWMFSGSFNPEFHKYERLEQVKWCKRVVSALFGIMTSIGGMYLTYFYVVSQDVRQDYLHDDPFKLRLSQLMFYWGLAYFIYDTFTLFYFRVYFKFDLIAHHAVSIWIALCVLRQGYWLGYNNVPGIFTLTDALQHITWLYCKVKRVKLSEAKLLNFLGVVFVFLFRVAVNVWNNVTLIYAGIVSWSNPDFLRDTWVATLVNMSSLNILVLFWAVKQIMQYASHNKQYVQKLYSVASNYSVPKLKGTGSDSD